MAKIGKKLLRVGSGGKSTKRNPTVQVQNENLAESPKTKRSTPNKNKEIDNIDKLKQDNAEKSKSAASIALGSSSKSTKNDPTKKQSKATSQAPPEKFLRNQKLKSKQSDLLQLANSLTPSESQPFRDDDEQTIGRLENECNRLSYTMKKFPKYSHEWFFLDSKLTAARQELEAAYEDRNLVLDFGLDENNVKPDDGSAGEEGPESVHFNFKGDGTNNSISTQQMKDTKEPLSDAVNSPPSDLSDITSEREEKMPQSKSPLHLRFDLPHDNEKAKDECERIARKLNEVPKFSPEWFQLKEEHLDFRISLLEGDARGNPSCEVGDAVLKNGPDKEEIDDTINAHVQNEQYPTKEVAHCGGLQQADDVTNHEDEIILHDKCEEENVPTESSEKVLSEEDLHDIDIEIPYNISSSRVPSYALSPSSSTAGSKSSSTHQRSLSPPLSPPTSPILGRQLFPPFTPPDVVIARSTVAGSYYYSQDDEGNIDEIHLPLPPSMQQQQQLQAKDTEPLKRRTRLKAEHAEACVKLGSFPKFSEPWFAAKTNVVLLEEQMDELENSSVGGGCGRSISGWSHFSSVSGGGGIGDSDRSASSSGWSDHEDESMSLGNEFGDVFERVMVVEALKQGNCVSPILSAENVDSNDQHLSPTMTHILGDVSTPTTVDIEKADAVIQESAATLIQTQWRRYIYSCKLSHSMKCLILIQRNCRKHMYWRKFRAKKSSSTTIQSYIRMKMQRKQFLRLVSSAITVQKAGRTFLARNQKKRLLSSPTRIPRAALLTPSTQPSNSTRSLESPQFISKSLLSPSGERSRLNVRVKRHKWLSLKLVHVKKYSDEWFETTALLREMKEEIEMLQKLSDDDNCNQQGREHIISTQGNDENASGNLVVGAEESVRNSNGRVLQVVNSMEQSQSGHANEDKGSSGSKDATELHHCGSEYPAPKTMQQHEDIDPCSKEKRLKQIGQECIRLSKKMTSLPKFSSEWFHSKAKLDAATQELESLYAEAMQSEPNCPL